VGRSVAETTGTKKNAAHPDGGPDGVPELSCNTTRSRSVSVGRGREQDQDHEQEQELRQAAVSVGKKLRALVWFLLRNREMRTDCLLIALAAALALTGCSKREKPLQTALDELRRLGAYTETGLNYTEYSNRLLTAKGNVAVVLQHSNDEGAKSRIENALNYYVEAQNAWKAKSEQGDSRAREIEEHLVKAREATESASTYTLADASKRNKIWEQENAILEAAAQASEEAKKQAAETHKARRAQEAQARALEQAASAKRVAEAAERERIRRFAPEGTVYSLKRITFTTEDGVTSIPAGTELKITRPASNGILRVQKDDLETDVPSAAVTNDRDVVAAIRAAQPVRRAVQDPRRRSASNQIVGAQPATR
jgi:hypothetical protein